MASLMIIDATSPFQFCCQWRGSWPTFSVRHSFAISSRRCKYVCQFVAFMICTARTAAKAFGAEPRLSLVRMWGCAVVFNKLSNKASNLGSCTGVFARSFLAPDFAMEATSQFSGSRYKARSLSSIHAGIGWLSDWQNSGMKVQSSDCLCTTEDSKTRSAADHTSASGRCNLNAALMTACADSSECVKQGRNKPSYIVTLKASTASPSGSSDKAACMFMTAFLVALVFNSGKPT
mmetsp:Transcript_40037/g.113529  ORF Transcript_40037/g.113529 Transcript_40037/m.113529 type:complete len:234 (-) Transcript_40037:497-1198(-)